MAMSELQKRLTQQLLPKHGAASADMALQLLIKRGHADPSGFLTSEGERRQELGNDGRAIDRKVKQRAGQLNASFQYNPQTNKAVRNTAVPKMKK